MEKPFVSVIMATHNNAPYIQEAIYSVLHQSYQHFELIVINDASTDATATILSDISRKDNRLVVLTHEKKQGLTVSLNAGIARAQGHYIARIDSDDLWSDRAKLEKQVSFLERHRETGIVGCWGYTIDTKGVKIAKLQYPIRNADIRKYVLIENCFIHSGVVIRTSCLAIVGRYNEHLKYAQDYELWLRIGKEAQLANVPEYMVCYRKNPKGMSKTYYRQQINETIASVKMHGNVYPFKSTSLLLWRTRLYIPYEIRESISQLVRTILFYSSFHTK